MYTTHVWGSCICTDLRTWRNLREILISNYNFFWLCLRPWVLAAPISLTRGFHTQGAQTWAPSLCLSYAAGVPASSPAGKPLSWADLFSPILWPSLWLHLQLYQAALPGWTLDLVHHLTLPGTVSRCCCQHPALPAVLRCCSTASWSGRHCLGSLSPPGAALLLLLLTSLIRNGRKNAFNHL